MRRVVPTEVDGHERGDETRGSKWRARIQPPREKKNGDRRRREGDGARDRHHGWSQADDGVGQRQRAGDQHDPAGDLTDALQTARGRHRAGEPAMDEITGNQRDQRDQHEGGVGRTAVEGHRGQQVVHQLERRRVSTERVKQHQGRSDGEDPDLARPRKAADKAEGQDGDQGQPAGVNEPHVLGEREARRPPGGVPDQAFRRPIIDVRVHGAEKIGKRELQEVHGVDRAGRRRREADFGAVRARGQQHGHDDRHGGDERGARRGGGKRHDARAHPGERLPAGNPMRQHKSGEHVKRQQRDLIPTERHQPGDRAGREPCPPRRAIERAR